MDRFLFTLLPFAAWCTYAPLGLKYASWLLTILLSAVIVHRRRGWRSVWAQPGTRLLLALLAVMALSATWSPATWSSIATHFWMYSLPVGAIMLAAACPPPAAKRALRHFALASACVGALSLLHSADALPGGVGWSTVTAEGNQRIATSILLALGSATSCWVALSKGRPILRVAWLALAGVAAAGLVVQDRRTGMVLLPVLLCAWTFTLPQRMAIKFGVLALVAAATVGAWLVSGGLRARFAEGVDEFRHYVPSDAVATSWGQRLRMLDISADIVAARPLFGHGLGSWRPLWDERITPGTLLASNSTPHNEYVLVAVQAGLPAALLLLAWLSAMVLRSARSGSEGAPALMVWLALMLVGLAHAVLRDAKFALPLLLLAGLTTALLRTDPGAEGHQGAPSNKT